MAKLPFRRVSSVAPTAQETAHAKVLVSSKKLFLHAFHSYDDLSAVFFAASNGQY